MGSLQLEDVTIGYNDQPIISNLNLTVCEGELLSLLGPSGVGKTTLLKTIAGLTPPIHGTISIDGNNLLGSQVLTAFNPTTPTLVDGKMSTQEAALLDEIIDEEMSWIWLSTDAGFDIYTELYIPSNFEAPISLHYVDNLSLEEKPERFTGQGPNIGYKMHQIPIDDTFQFRFDAYFTDTIGALTPQEFAVRIKDIPAVASQRITEEFDIANAPTNKDH